MKKGVKKYLAAGVFLLLLLAGTGCGGAKGTADKEQLADGVTAISEEDPLGIRSIIVGDTEGQAVAVTEDGVTTYAIQVTLPVDFSFSKTTLNLELAEGAELSKESSCYVNDLGGRPVVNLTVEDAALIIENEEESREYRFLIELS